MTENMEKLMELVTEVSDLTKKVDEETKQMKAQYDANNQAKLDRIRSELKGYTEIARELDRDVYVKIDGYSRYCNGDARDHLCIKVWRGCYDYGVYDWNKGMHSTYLGHLGPNYKCAKRGDYNSNLSYDIDEIINNWNSEQFEHDFSLAVREIIKKKAELANKNYEEAKRRLEGQKA